MAIEVDTPPPPNTFRRWLWQEFSGIRFLRGYWGRRFMGGAYGLIADIFAEVMDQAFYARLPGHPEQAPDSLQQSAADRDLYRFRGESDANWLARVQSAWDDYEQGGSKIQMLRVINQWGAAGFPLSWSNGTVTIDENIGPTFAFRITIPFGMILPAWPAEAYGNGKLYGNAGFFYGLSQQIDLAMLIYIVRKWKGSRNRAIVKIYTTATNFVNITVA